MGIIDIVRLSLVIFVTGCILPSAFASGATCYTCTESPLQSPEQCNMSNTIFYPCLSFRCVTITAELTNGTLVGIRGCSSGYGICNITSCNQRNESLSGPVYFKRCVAECCFDSICNGGLFPMLPELPSPSPVPAIPSSSIAGSAKDPTVAGIKMKAFLYLPIVLPIIIEIMS
ncbi:hypothetical protein ACROYT_G019007 [Oculina patagonica]